MRVALNKKALNEADARDLGVTTLHEQMENGELRFRLVAADGSSYIRTVATSIGGWQNSHYHKGVLETYISQEGCSFLVELMDDELVWHPLNPGDVFTTQPDIPHNMYLPAGAILHTVKHGDGGSGSDWHAAPELDARTKGLSEEEILRMVPAKV